VLRAQRNSCLALAPFTNTQARAPFICAHGGDTSKHPPNTAAAIAAAIANGADCIELDAATTRDGRLVAMHVRDLHRLLQYNSTHAHTIIPAAAPAPPQAPAAAAQTATIEEFSLEQLLSLSWPTGEHPLPFEASLSAALSAPSTELALIDLKDQHSRSAAQLLRAAAAAGCKRRRCVIWGKSDDAMQMIRRLDPQQVRGARQLVVRFVCVRVCSLCVRGACEVPGKMVAPSWLPLCTPSLHTTQPTGYVVMLPPSALTADDQPDSAQQQQQQHQKVALSQLQPSGFAVAGVYHRLADATVLAAVHLSRQLLIAWTVDTQSDLVRLLEFGVDGLVVNHLEPTVGSVANRLAVCMRRRLLV